jgi:hypothetical protein
VRRNCDPNIGEKIIKIHELFVDYIFFVLFLNILIMPFGFNVTGNLTITVVSIITYLITYLLQQKKLLGHIFWMPGVPYQ